MLSINGKVIITKSTIKQIYNARDIAIFYCYSLSYLIAYKNIDTEQI